MYPIIQKDPGETWRNDTGRVLYQFIVQWHNSCGTCCQYDHMIGPSWPIPLHFGCNCVQRLVAPGQTSLPFVDFREKVRELDPAQKSRVIGASNLLLVEKGVVGWDDVVMAGRIRDLREVVSAKKLTVDRMVKAGVKRSIAEEAYRDVHTAAHDLADRQRQEILERLKALGVTRERARSEVAARLAGRVTIQRPSPGGPTTPPPSPPPPSGPTPPAPTPPAVPPSLPLPVVPKALTREQVEKSLGVKLKAAPPAPAPAPAPKPGPPPREPLPAPPPLGEGASAADRAVRRAERIAAALGVATRVLGAQSLAAEFGFTERQVVGVPAMYEAGPDRIVLNRDSPYWADQAADAREGRAAGWWSTDDPDHVIAHEVGHAEHRRNVGLDAYRIVNWSTLNDEQRRMIEKHVSRYGATDRREFVAEVYAMLRAGKTLPDEAMALYREIGGVVP